MDVTLPPDLLVWGLATQQNTTPWTLPPSIMKPIWDRGITGAGTIGAVLDTGYEPHRVLPEAKDYLNFTNESDRLRNSHGIHVASSMLGRNGIGAAPGADLVAVKVLAGSGGSGSSDWIARGFRAAADAGADVVNASLGGPSPYAPTRDALAYCISKGCLPIAAAGNAGFNGRTNSMGYPARFDSDVIAVGATQGPYDNQRIASYSSGGREIDFAVGGSQILGAVAGNQMGIMSGTSMATPLFSGFVLLAIEVLRLAGKPRPTTYAGWKDIFKDIARDSGQPGFDQSFGHGIIYPTDIVTILTNAIDAWGL